MMHPGAHLRFQKSVAQLLTVRILHACACSDIMKSYQRQPIPVVISLQFLSSSLSSFSFSSLPFVRMAKQGCPHGQTGQSASAWQMQQCHIGKYAPGYINIKKGVSK
jgi:hypothetical protein